MSQLRKVWIHDEDGNAFTSDNPLPTTTSSNLALHVLIDSVDENIVYKGEAEIGSVTSGASWRIQKLDFTGGEVVKTWADGDDSFDNILDNRESLSYS